LSENSNDFNFYQVSAELNEASARAEGINRAIKTLENKNMIDEGSEETS
jgi:hypothetical protein